MKAASKSQGPKRCRREEHLGLAGEGSGVGWSGKVPAQILYKDKAIIITFTLTVIPVTAERTNAEVEAIKLGPMDGGRELTKRVVL